MNKPLLPIQQTKLDEFIKENKTAFKLAMFITQTARLGVIKMSVVEISKIINEPTNKVRKQLDLFCRFRLIKKERYKNITKITILKEFEK